LLQARIAISRTDRQSTVHNTINSGLGNNGHWLALTNNAKYCVIKVIRLKNLTAGN